MVLHFGAYRAASSVPCCQYCVVLRDVRVWCYGMCGTDAAYDATRGTSGQGKATEGGSYTRCYAPTPLLCAVPYSCSVCSYALGMRCPVLTERMLLRASCAMSGTDLAYAVANRRKNSTRLSVTSFSPSGSKSPLWSCAMSGTDAGYAPTRRESEASPTGSGGELYRYCKLVPMSVYGALRSWYCVLYQSRGCTEAAAWYCAVPGPFLGEVPCSRRPGDTLSCYARATRCPVLT
eukprot:1952229-Rhodomonas_salina.1